MSESPNNACNRDKTHLRLGWLVVPRLSEGYLLDLTWISEIFIVSTRALPHLSSGQQELFVQLGTLSFLCTPLYLYFALY